jgi:hypothetical protein
MTFDKDLFERVVSEGTYLRESVEDACHHLVFSAKVDADKFLVLQGIEPEPDYMISKTGGSGIRASPSGPAEVVEGLNRLLVAYREARRERRSKNLVNLLKGDAWGERDRSLQIFQCSICGSLSNRITCYRMQGPAFHCLGAAKEPIFHVTKKDWHRLAGDKLVEHGNLVHPASYRAELAREVSALVNERPFHNDLVGDPAPKLVHFTMKGVIPCTGADDGYRHFKDWEP